MRDIQRIAREVRFLAQGDPSIGLRGLGPDVVFFDDEGKFLFFPEFRLPADYRRSTTPLLVVIPDGYGHGAPLGDNFVATDLARQNGRKPSRLYSSLKSSLLPDGSENGRGNPRLAGLVQYPGSIPPLSYLCLHAQSDVTVWEYLEQLYTYLSNPVG